MSQRKENQNAEFTVEQYQTERVSILSTDLRKDLRDINGINKKTLNPRGGAMSYDFFTGVFLPNPNLIFLVARHAKTGKIVGKWSLYLMPLDHGIMRAYTEQVAVHPDFQGTGIGSALCKKAHNILASIAQGKNVVIKEDLSSSDEKKDAHRLYKSARYKRRKTNNFRRVFLPWKK